MIKEKFFQLYFSFEVSVDNGTLDVKDFQKVFIMTRG